MTGRAERIFGVAVAVLAFVTVAMATISVMQARRQARAAATRVAEAAVRSLAAAAVDEVYGLDVRALRARLASVRLDPEISDVYITDVNGAVVADGTADNRLRGKVPDEPFLGELLKSRLPSWELQERTVTAGGPIEMADGTVLGFVVLKRALNGGAVAHTVAENAAGGALLLVLCYGLLWLVRGSAVAKTSTGSVATGPAERESVSVPAATLLEETPVTDAAPLRKEEGEVGIPRGVFEHLLNGIGDGVIGTSASGIITSVNNGALALVGYTREELEGQTLALVLDDGHGEPEELAARTVSAPAARTLTCKDGSRRPVWLRAVVVRRPDGALREVLYVVHPVREEAEPRAEARQPAAEEGSWESMRRELEAARQEAAQARAEAGELRARAERAESVAATKPDEHEVEALRAQVRAAREELDKAHREIEQIHSEAETARSETAAVEERLHAALSELARLREEREELQRRIADAETSPAAADVTALAAERDKLVELLEETRAERDRALRDLERRQAEWQEQAERRKRERLAPSLVLSPGAPSAAQAVSVGGEVGEQPVLDREEALAGVEGDLEFLRALVDVFLESSARQMADLGAAVERGDQAAVERTARMLKNVLSTFGARAASAAALQLETIGIVGDMGHAAQAYERLDAEIERLKPALVELVSGAGG